MRARTVILRQQILEAAAALQARHEPPSGRRIAEEIGLRPTQCTAVWRHLADLIATGALSISACPGGRPKGSKDQRPRSRAGYRSGALRRWREFRRVERDVGGEF